MPKEILVTIDDSPGPASGALLDELHRLGIKTALFCIGAQLDQDRSVAERAVAEGHLLGNHSYGHSWYSKLDIEEIIADIDRADQLIDETYHAVGVPRPLKIFRYPFGDKGVGNSRFKMPLRRLSRRFRTVQRHLLDRGYVPLRPDGLAMHAPLSWCRGDIDWSWTCDLKEFNSRPWEEMASEMSAIVQRPGREVLLLHDHIGTTERVSRILGTLSGSQVHFVNPIHAALPR